MHKFKLALSLLVFAGVVVLVSAGTDFYKILEIPRNADVNTIKRAYRKLSVKHHPDKSNAPDAKDKFASIARAYEVLSDPEKKQIYDRHGEEGLKQQEQRGGGGGGDPFDIFSQFGFPFGGGQRGRQERRGPTIRVPLAVNLEDLYTGKDIEFDYKKQTICHQCQGSGARTQEDVVQCKKCGGRGHRVEMHQLGPGFVQQVQVQCDACGGKGKVVKHKCPVCGGNKVVTGDTPLTVMLEAGMPNGHEITFDREGDHFAETDITPGDVVFVVRTQPHKRFRRDDSNPANLHYESTITLKEALTGFTKALKHLDGRKVTYSSDGITRPGQVMTLIDEGLPIFQRGGAKGNLYIHFTVKFPESLTDDQKTKFKELLP